MLKQDNRPQLEDHTDMNEMLGATKWTNGLRRDYDQIMVERIPSDVGVYDSSWALVNFYAAGGRVVDFGSLSGINTANMAEQVQAEIVGVDIHQQNVDNANTSHGREGLNFAYIPEIGQFPPGLGRFNAAFAGFVIPTISNRVALEDFIKKTYDALEPGGIFVSLQLNPDSLSDDAHYTYYHHRLPDGGVYEDGKPFDNTLESHNGSTVSFTDTCWKPETLYAMLEAQGYKNIEIVNLTRGMPGIMGRALDHEIKVLEEKYEVEWKDEWGPRVPLYQIIWAKKADSILTDRMIHRPVITEG